MKLERSKNAKNGIIYGGIYAVINIVLPFIVQTVVIKVLGIEYGGVRGLFSSIIAVLGLSELGFGVAIVYSMYKPIAMDDKEAIGALYGLYKKAYKLIGTIIILLGVSLMPFVKNLIKDQPPKELNIYIVFALYLADVVLSYFLYAYKTSLLNAYQRVDVLSKINIAVALILNFFQIIAVVILRNFYAYLLAAIISTIIRNLCISFVVDKMFPEIKAHGQISREIKKEIKINILGVMIGKICGITRNSFDSVFISMFLGLSVTAMYSNYYYVLAALNSIMVVISNALIGGVGNSIKTDSVEKNYNDMLVMNYIYMIIGSWMSACMLCLYQPFMQLWMGKELLFPTSTMIAFVVYFFVGKLGDIRGVYADAAGLFWENRHRTIAEAVANIVLNYWLVQLWGVFGIVIATIFSLFFIGFIGSTIVIFKYYFKNGIKRYFITQIQVAVTGIVISVIMYWICNFVEINNYWGEFFVKGIICSIGSALLIIVLQCRTKIFRTSVAWIKNHI